MSDIASIQKRYQSADYISRNPSWDVEDSPWKARKVRELLDANRIVPKSMVDVGCGAGSVLVQMMSVYPKAQLTGYDIAPDAERFWASPRAFGIHLVTGDFLESNVPVNDVLLLLDVVEHLLDPFAFLVKLRGRAKHYVFHFPLTFQLPVFCAKHRCCWFVIRSATFTIIPADLCSPCSKNVVIE
jgi:2-polyprenyl-3-methyl-5-hydroxy-6-metoxy-1,4-benzoquinol methylase